MSNTVTVEKNLVGHFKQASGGSRLGVDWAVRITGARDGMVVVRTYFSSDMPQEAEKKALADKAALFVQRKLGRAGFHGRASWSMKMTCPDQSLRPKLPTGCAVAEGGTLGGQKPYVGQRFT